MSTDDTDVKLKKLFQEQRLKHEGETPEFNKILKKSSRQSPMVFKWQLAVAACIIFLFAISVPVFYKTKSASTNVDLEQWEKLTNWEASSDSLLTDTHAILGSEFKTSSDSWFTSDSSDEEMSQ